MADFNYTVLGSGMQGAAAGYSLARFGSAKSLTMADLNLETAKEAANRINHLLGKPIAQAKQVDASNTEELKKLFQGQHGVFSSTVYQLNVGITLAAIDAGVHLVDLGGNTHIVRQQLELHKRALEKGISIIPDCGLAPGLGNTFASYGISQLDECKEVKIRCGGLPQNPKPPLGYKLVFNIGGLTNEYFGTAYCLKNGEVTEVPTFSGLEVLKFAEPVGECEAFITTGGTSTCPWTYQSKVQTYDYKTVRYPGHFEKVKCMLDLGLLDEEPVEVDGQKVSPRAVFHKVAEPHLRFPEDRDLVVLRVVCSGTKNNKATNLEFEVIDFHDEETGFTAMERMTAFPAALSLMLSVRGKNLKGAVPLETGLDNESFMKELPEHGIKIQKRTF